MTAAARKKKNEFRWFQMFQRISPGCPQGKPLHRKRQKPDIIFPKLALGIEITEYILGQGRKGSPLRRLETVRRKIVRDAQAGYERHGTRRLQVTVIWANLDCPSKCEEDQLARAITRLLLSLDWQQRRIWHVDWEHFVEPILQKYVQEVSAYSLDANESCWGSSAVAWLSGAKERLQRALEQKESKVVQYRQFCREIWLLIVASRGWLSSMYFDDAAEALNGTFASSFDRAFLLDERTATVSELSLHAPPKE
jgi:hypothetical protein